MLVLDKMTDYILNHLYLDIYISKNIKICFRILYYFDIVRYNKIDITLNYISKVFLINFYYYILRFNLKMWKHETVVKISIVLNIW